MALDNFEQSLVLIKKLEGTLEEVGNLIVAKIYLNIGIISGHLGM